MPNPYGAPEIDVHNYAGKVEAGDAVITLDVREENELAFAALPEGQVTRLPLSELARRQQDALTGTLADKDAEIVVMCHHGVRSAQVTAWLIQNGYTNVLSLEGGIDAYAREIDPSVGRY